MDPIKEPNLVAHPARALVRRLVDRGFSPEQIASALNGRVSSRTVYRWGQGGSDPQNDSDLDELRRLADTLAPEKVAVTS